VFLLFSSSRPSLPLCVPQVLLVVKSSMSLRGLVGQYRPAALLLPDRFQADSLLSLPLELWFRILNSGTEGLDPRKIPFPSPFFPRKAPGLR